MIAECGAAIAMNCSSGNGQCPSDLNTKGVDDGSAIMMGNGSNSAMDGRIAASGIGSGIKG